MRRVMVKKCVCVCVRDCCSGGEGLGMSEVILLSVVKGGWVSGCGYKVMLVVGKVVVV